MLFGLSLRGPGKARRGGWGSSDEDFIVDDLVDGSDSSQEDAEPPGLQSCGNALVLSGPCGCGKTAAVYACALLPGLDQGLGLQLPPATLILCEEVDLLLDEDKGFYAALVTLISDTKRPMILTLNSSQIPPALLSLGLTQLHFSPPSPSMLLRTACLVACAEGFGSSPHVPLSLLQQVV
ncbi:p-loop containing nucleoside triphosphate hydrolase protein, partial [Haematococcus lacustris]